MKNALLFLLFCLLPLEVFGQQEAGFSQTALVFTDVTVIDATGAPAKPDMTVVIKGDRIAALGKTANLDVPENAQVVDATGKFLIPGLWDMHAQIWLGKRYLALFTANGVTGIRVTWGKPEYHKWRKEISAGELIGPRMVIASPILDGPKTTRNFVVVSNEKEGRQLVRKFKEEGADFIKVYSYLPRDAYFAIADEAKKQGLPFAGHVPLSVSAAETSDAGQHSAEHISSILIACSSIEEQIKKKLMEGQPIPRFLKLITETYSEQKAVELFARFVKNSTWVCPTVLPRRGLLWLDAEDLANDPRLKYIPSTVVDSWRSLEKDASRVPAYYQADFKRFCQKNLDLVGAMGRAGVGLLAGTDTPVPYCLPGFGLHDELTLLVQAGLSPMEALRTATYNPAKFFGKLDSMGTIEQGKIADLVLLDANPLQDISNTQKIAAVVVGGKIFERAALQKMLAQVQAQAAIHQAAADGEIERFKLLISEGPDVNAKDEKGLTPLHHAAREGHKEIVEVLLSHGADVNLAEKYNNRTAAEFAMKGNHNEVAELLISKGADISPLHFALHMKDEAKARSLIEGGADVNNRTPKGTTPLNRAIGKGLKDIVELLIARGADVNAGHYWGWTPLHGAAEEGHKDIVKLLIAKGANVKARDGASRTPLWYAQEEGHTEIVELLRKHGAKE